MAISYCEEKHTPGEPFESGNVYCKKCGEYLYTAWADPVLRGVHDSMFALENEGLTAKYDDPEPSDGTK